MGKCVWPAEAGGGRTELAPYLALWHTRSPTVRTHSVWRDTWSNLPLPDGGKEHWHFSMELKIGGAIEFSARTINFFFYFLFLPCSISWASHHIDWSYSPPPTPRSSRPPAWQLMQRQWGKNGSGVQRFRKLGRSNPSLEIFTKSAKQWETVSVGFLEWREVNNVVHLGSVWGPMLFNVFIIDSEEQAESTRVKAAEGTELFHLVNTTESCREFRKDFP